MDKDFALKLAADIAIDVQQVIREEAELVFLRGLFESSISDNLIFKGGTALRLLYGSARFSEDLDFSSMGSITPTEFKKVITGIVKADSRFSITDIASKYYTHLAEIRIRETWRNLALSLKIEISKRIINEDKTDIVTMLAKSDATNITVMAKAFSLAQILEEKSQAIQERRMPRDIFDIWFICQKINRPFSLNKFGYKKGKIRQELRKLLPKKYYPVIEELEKLNA